MKSIKQMIFKTVDFAIKSCVCIQQQFKTKEREKNTLD